MNSCKCADKNICLYLSNKEELMNQFLLATKSLIKLLREERISDIGDCLRSRERYIEDIDALDERISEIKNNGYEHRHYPTGKTEQDIAEMTRSIYKTSREALELSGECESLQKNIYEVLKKRISGSNPGTVSARRHRGKHRTPITPRFIDITY